MSDLQIYSEKFRRQLEEIQKYIFSLDMQKNVISELSILEKMGGSTPNLEATLKYSKVLKDVIKTPIQYNAVIISIYGSLEQFINELFEGYCNLLYDAIDNYDNIPVKMREKHIKRLGEFLSNPQRYKNYELTEKEAIENALLAFEKPRIGLQNNQSLLLAHAGNLKMDQISELANGLGIGGLEKKIVFNYIFRDYYVHNNQYSDKSYESIAARESKNLFILLDKLVDARNDVAHGWVENRIKLSDLSEEYIEYLKIFAEAISEVLMNDIMCKKLEMGKLHSIGKPQKVYDHHIVCINNSNALLKVNDTILAVKENSKKVLKIQSIEKNKKKIEEIIEYGVDVGIEFIKRQDLYVDERYEIFCER